MNDGADAIAFSTATPGGDCALSRIELDVFTGKQIGALGDFRLAV